MFIVIDCTPGIVPFRFAVLPLIVLHCVVVNILLSGGDAINELINPLLLANIEYVSDIVTLPSLLISNLKKSLLFRASDPKVTLFEICASLICNVGKVGGVKVM